MLRTIKKGYNKAVNALCIADMALLVIIVFYQVLARKVFSSSPIWTGELARFLMVWLIFVGSSIAFREREHLGVDYFTGLLPQGFRNAILLIVDIILLMTMVFIIYNGYKLGIFVERQLSPAMRISMLIPYFAIPAGGLMMAVEIIWHLLFDYRKGKTEEVR